MLIGCVTLGETDLLRAVHPRKASHMKTPAARVWRTEVTGGKKKLISQSKSSKTGRHDKVNPK